MTRIELSQADIRDLEDAMDDPSLSGKHRIKLLVIRMHSEGARHGFIAKCLKLHAIPITLILDNARYQRCKEVATHAASKDIERLYLPAYSPNLNLIERLWKPTKKKCLTNRHYPAFAQFRAAIDDCPRKMSRDYLPELKTLLTLNFQFFPFHKSS